MKVGIVGASGFIGRNLFHFLKSKGMDVLGTYCGTPAEGLYKFDLLSDDPVLFSGCSAVIVSSAMTKIDECFQQRQKAYMVNVSKTVSLITYCIAQGMKPVFLSSDQVFDGRRGNYSEEDRTSPLNYYGRFKVEVEEYLRQATDDYLILRLSKTYTHRREKGGIVWDMVDQMRRGEPVKAAVDKIYNPTDVEYVCAGVHHALTVPLRGIYHLAQPVQMSSLEFCLDIARQYGLNTKYIQPILFRVLSFIEPRALDSSMNTRKFLNTMKEGTREKSAVCQ